MCVKLNDLSKTLASQFNIMNHKSVLNSKKDYIKLQNSVLGLQTV